MEILALTVSTAAGLAMGSLMSLGVSLYQMSPRNTSHTTGTAFWWGGAAGLLIAGLLGLHGSPWAGGLGAGFLVAYPYHTLRFLELEGQLRWLSAWSRRGSWWGCIGLLALMTAHRRVSGCWLERLLAQPAMRANPLFRWIAGRWGHRHRITIEAAARAGDGRLFSCLWKKRAHKYPGEAAEILQALDAPAGSFQHLQPRDLTPLLEHYHGPVRQQAIRALGKLPENPA